MAPSQTVQPMPLTVGVYYPSVTRNYHHRFTYGTNFDIHVGEMTVNFWNSVFKQAFDKTFLLEESELKTYLGVQHMDGILEVSIKDFSHQYASGKGYSRRGASASLLIEFVLHCPDGEQIAAWLVRGNATMLPKIISPTYKTQLRSPIQSAFLDAAEQFMSSLPQQFKNTIECP